MGNPHINTGQSAAPSMAQQKGAMPSVQNGSDRAGRTVRFPAGNQQLQQRVVIIANQKMHFFKQVRALTPEQESHVRQKLDTQIKGLFEQVKSENPEMSDTKAMDRVEQRMLNPNNSGTQKTESAAQKTLPTPPDEKKVQSGLDRLRNMQAEFEKEAAKPEAERKSEAAEPEVVSAPPLMLRSSSYADARDAVKNLNQDQKLAMIDGKITPVDSKAAEHKQKPAIKEVLKECRRELKRDDANLEKVKDTLGQLENNPSSRAFIKNTRSLKKEVRSLNKTIHQKKVEASRSFAAEAKSGIPQGKLNSEETQRLQNLVNKLGHKKETPDDFKELLELRNRLELSTGKSEKKLLKTCDKTLKQHTSLSRSEKRKLNRASAGKIKYTKDVHQALSKQIRSYMLERSQGKEAAAAKEQIFGNLHSFNDAERNPTARSNAKNLPETIIKGRQYVGHFQKSAGRSSAPLGKELF